jgi:hypothetical protein
VLLKKRGSGGSAAKVIELEWRVRFFGLCTGGFEFRIDTFVDERAR